MSNRVIQRLPNTVKKGSAEYFDFSGIAAGDIVLSGEGAAGRKWTTISCGPLTVGTKTRIVSKFPFAAFPSRTFFEMSVSQRYRAYNGLVYLASQDTESTVPAPKALSIASIQQTTTLLTVVLNDAFDGGVGDWVNITDVPDNRLCYFNLCVATVSLDKKTLTATVADEATIPSLTVGPYAGVGTLTRIEPFGLANNAVGLRTSGTTATSNALLSRFGGGEGYFTSGTIAGNQLIGTATTAAIWNASTTGQVAVSATSRFMFDCNARDVSLLDKTVDSISAFAPRIVLTNVKPDDARDYFFVFETVSPASSPVPVAKIVSAVKTGTTTATITTDVPHGLTTSSYVQTYGIRDVTNFPNLAAATVVASIVSPTVFTIVIAGAVTATSYGGAVTVCNGGYTQPGLIGQTVQSVARGVDGNVTVVGNTTWSGLQVGGLVNLHGVRDAATGADLGFDGCYRVMSLVTTTLILVPVYDYLGVLQSPTGGVVTTTNAGGCIIDRVEYRTHDIGVETFEEKIVQIDGQGTASAAKAIPVVMAVNPTVNQGTAASVSGTSGLGGWYVHPAIVGIADIASAAITTTATSSAISNSLGNGFQVTFTVTTITGTTPSIDLKVEESFDGGTNWEQLYHFQRITAYGNYNSPVLRATGRHIRYVRTVGGTTPSITNAVTRNILPFMPSEPQKRIYDRAFSASTLNAVTPVLFQGAANNVQLAITIGTATTPFAMQLEGSEDNLNWYPLGSPLTAVASSTVEMTVNAKSATYTRGRVSTAGVSVAAGYFVSIKAWS